MTDNLATLPPLNDRPHLQSRVALQLTGPDTSAFLHAQLTSDIQSQVSESVAWSAWLTPKGRVISTLLVARLEAQCFLLVVPASLAEILKKRLKMFVMRSKVEISEVPATHSVVLGEAAERWHSSQGLPTNGLLATADGVAMHIATDHAAQNGGHGLADGNDSASNAGASSGAIYCIDYKQTLPGATQSATSADDESDWNDWCVMHGLPWIDAATTEGFIPQSLNLDAIGGLSYDKGCYPGQEIVARTHFKGRLKYRSAIANFEANPNLSVGEKVAVVSDSSRSATVLVTGRQRALLVVPVGWLDNETAALEISAIDSDTSARAFIEAPPYELPEG